ncbi:hypothetical protein LVISKB_2169 [Levilactobacillus brevis KB290]|uniref:Uncharacterized protein n=1 Tax=Levilactobacillus brevis KB290 TaxID=1001583 RepID=M5AG41_LEVBR|nr:hypothetical protein LVISKB_2169 [Levilactobacillus brevis KB290]
MKGGNKIMTNKELAAHWHEKLMRTPASYQALATYRFQQWEHFEALAHKELAESWEN